MAFLKFLARHSVDLAYWLVITVVMAIGGLVFFRYRAKDCVFDMTDPAIWHPFVEHEHISPAKITLGSYIIPSVSIIFGTFFKNLLIKKETGKGAPIRRVF
ncbi:MAG: hypothetical protein GOMPHAMPRED_006634 [Gomphillus americanus]|uniref:Uncharacterized protein n=1 Tax=Gomphillus americanus TaxID=1940652 RepID=A0A8H3FXB0_9LECA|nr:MAG: hypothetical protein GOMPHAMPRED_006634 [Gomphillus americanus]